MAVRLSALRTGRCFTPQKHYFYASGTHLCYRLSKPQGLGRPEGLGKLINIIYLIRSRTRDLPVCNIPPWPLCYRVPPKVYECAVKLLVLLEPEA
jgi:hypothetical protein